MAISTSESDFNLSSNDGNIAKSSVVPSENNSMLKEKLSSSKDAPKEEYILYGYRHFELTIYCFASMCNQITWISLQPVAGAIQNGYGYGSAAISAIGITYMIVFIIVNYPSNYLIERYGLRIGVSLPWASELSQHDVRSHSYRPNKFVSSFSLGRLPFSILTKFKPFCCIRYLSEWPLLRLEWPSNAPSTSTLSSS